MILHNLQFDEEDSRAQLPGILLVELAHTRTPFSDQTREFENALTELLGEVGVEALS